MSKNSQDWIPYSLRGSLVLLLTCKHQMDHNRILTQHKGEQIYNFLQDQSPPKAMLVLH